MNRLAIFVLSLVLALQVSAQSLGDVARRQRQKKTDQQESKATKKVLTNDDISKSGDPATPVDSSKKEKQAGAQSNSSRVNSGSGESLSAEEWKAKIQEEKDAIADLEDRISTLQSSVHYVQNNRNIYTNAPEYNDYQHRKELEVQALKAQLEEHKSDLKDLQEQARQAGFGSAVYQ
jgi:hypothetical protein